MTLFLKSFEEAGGFMKIEIVNQVYGIFAASCFVHKEGAEFVSF